MLQCSQQCGEGERTREVVCLSRDYRRSEECEWGDMPERTGSCQEQRCGGKDIGDTRDEEELDSNSDADIVEEVDSEEEDDFEGNESEDCKLLCGKVFPLIPHNFSPIYRGDN